MIGISKRFKCLLMFMAILFLSTCLKASAQEQVSQADNLRLVRVGISDNSFHSLVYKELSIISTAEYAVYNKQTKKLIAKLSPSDILKIKFISGNLVLSAKNKILAKDINDTIVIDSPAGLLGVENHKRNGRQALYRGKFEIIPKNDSCFYLVNVLDLESYLKGVVPNEMPVRFGLEALKAQTVAARNYVLMPRTRSYNEFDVDDSVASQVYFGANTESELSNRAVKETEGLVALYGWDLILAQYSSTAGGYTENYENAFSDPKTKEFPPKAKPYLKGRPDIYSVMPLNREEEARIFYMGCPDSYDMRSPYYRWKREWGVNAGVNAGAGAISSVKTEDKSNETEDKKNTTVTAAKKVNELAEVLKRTLVEQSKTGFVKPEFKNTDILETLKELRVKRRGVSGKIMELEIVTSNQTYHVYKELVIRRLLQKNGVSLPSANVVFDNVYDANHNLIKVVAYGGGYGHGVGMSQYGAGFMATSLKKPFDKILKRYYTGITISTTPTVLSCQNGILTQTFYSPRAKATLVVDNKYQIKQFNANINGRDVAFELANKIVTFQRLSRIDISSYVKAGRNVVTFYFPECEKNKGIRLYIEVVEKDDSEYNF